MQVELNIQGLNAWNMFSQLWEDIKINNHRLQPKWLLNLGAAASAF